MKKAILLVAGVLCTLTATAQQKQNVIIGNGMSTRDVRTVPPFTQLEVNGPFEVRLLSAEDGPVVIEGEKNLTSLITTQVQDSKLTIAPKADQLFKSSKGHKIIIKVPAQLLTGIILNGSGSIVSTKPINKNLEVKLNGSGTIKLDVTNMYVNAVVNGSGQVVITGTTNTFTAVVNESGSINAEDLAYDVHSVTGSGTGIALLKNK